MKTLRITATVLPQLYLILLVGGMVDLLGGWNHTDSAFTVLIVLFVLTPLLALFLLVAESVITIASDRESRGNRSYRKMWFAAVLVAESIMINIFILSQLRMH